MSSKTMMPPLKVSFNDWYDYSKTSSKIDVTKLNQLANAFFSQKIAVRYETYQESEWGKTKERLEEILGLNGISDQTGKYALEGLVDLERQANRRCQTQIDEDKNVFAPFRQQEGVRLKNLQASLGEILQSYRGKIAEKEKNFAIQKQQLNNLQSVVQDSKKIKKTTEDVLETLKKNREGFTMKEAMIGGGLLFFMGCSVGLLINLGKK